MSGIDDLIRELCPSGVLHVSLGDIGTVFGGLTGKSKADFSNGNCRYVSYTNVFTNLATNVESGDFVRIGSAEKQRILRRGDILFTGSSETADEVGMSSVVDVDIKEPIYLNSFCIGYRLNDPAALDPGFAKHLFRSAKLRKQIVRTASGVTRFNVSKARLLKVNIPLPPITVQKQIALVLDTFTELEAELEAELKAELEARRRQYAHYRRSSFDFSRNSYELHTLRDVADFRNAKAHEKLVNSDGEIKLMTSKFIATQGQSARRIRREDVLTPAFRDEIALVMSDLPNGRALARAFHVDADDTYAANQRVGLLTVKDRTEILPKFFFYAIDRNDQLLAYDSGVDQTHLKKDWIINIKIPIPPLSEQEHIVSILDKFDALANDLSIGLPAELTARRQQYEYYRDKLFTFKDLAA